MTDPTYRQRLLALDQAQYQGEPLSDVDEAFLYTILNVDAIPDALRVRVGLLLTCEEDPVLERFLAAFPDFSLNVKKLLVPLLCGLDIYPPYKMLFDLLKSTLDENLADWIILSMSKSQYPLAMPVIFYVGDPDVLFHRRIKRLVAKMGLKKLGPFLAMMPEVPHAQVYEEIFGDLAFRRLRSRKK